MVGTLGSVAAIEDMLAPVVLITTSVIVANSLLGAYTTLVNRERLDPKPAVTARRIYLAIMIVLGGAVLFIASVSWIALAIAYRSNTYGTVAVWLVLMGLLALLAALVLVATAYHHARRR
jgi:apolipoprotein N-acyltransferase